MDKPSRVGLARAVGRLRVLFEQEFTQQASGRFGLHARPGQSIEPLEAIAPTPTQAAERNELVGAIEYLQREGLSGSDAVARVLREAAFTAVNRLLAVRVAEAVGALPEATTRGRQSAGYREVVHDLFPILSQDQDEGFWTYLQVCGDELGATVPLLFDRRLPTSAFVPSRACVDAALVIVNDPEVAQLWGDPEALGWAYQFFNGTENDELRKASSEARNSRELAVRNQFFTPRYVVDWLVQNTLGRRLRQAGYLLDLPLLVGEIGQQASLRLEEVQVLDPAVGSGHFLLGCYDLLEQAWQSAGVGAPDAAPRILRCLSGIDIDPRAAQVAQAVLVLRARRSAPTGPLDPPAIVTARPLPADPAVRAEVFDALSSNARDLAVELDAALADAPLLGSVLKVEQRLQNMFERLRATPKLAEDVTPKGLKRELLGALAELSSRAGASPPARMFAANAGDAIRFVELCQQRYDVVLMNPPFGGPIVGTKDAIRAAYGSSAVDLYATFVDRGVALLRDDGYLGAITSRTGFIVTTFEEWRSRLVLPRMRALLDLGQGVMHNAMVEAAAYVLDARPQHDEAVFRRLVDVADKATAVYTGGGEVFVRRSNDFAVLPGLPAAYWLPPELLELYGRHASIEAAQGVDARLGPHTGDDFRYVRCWWEVHSSGAIDRSPRWVSFAKGGEYSPYYAYVYLVVDWDYERGTFRDFHGRKGRSSPIPENRDFFGRPGLTWSRRSQKGFSVRPVPRGCVFSDKGPMLFADSDSPTDLDRLMAYLNSGLAAALIEGLVAFGSYEVGAVQRLPYLNPGAEAGAVTRELTESRMREAQHRETDHLFVSPWAAVGPESRDVAKLSRQVDEAIIRSAELAQPVIPLSSTYATLWFEDEYQAVGPPTPHQELSYLMGAALGRWDIRIATGAIEPPPMPGPYDPLPATARGMLLDVTGLPAAAAPDGYPLVLPADHILHDERGHPLDVVTAIEAAADALVGIIGGTAPGVRDLRQHLRDRFFADHLKDYTASNRYAPIYWQLTVPSKRWGLWLYAPALSREMLFAVEGAARDKLRRLREQATRLRDQLGIRQDRATIERVEALEALAREVDVYAETADRVAQSGWVPDLNDGLVLCAAPIESLFVHTGWRGRIADQRAHLQRGAYPWASVQRMYFKT